MNNLFIDYSILEHRPDPRLVMVATGALIVILSYMALRAICRTLWQKSSPLELSTTRIDNVECIANALTAQILRCEHAKDFNEALKGIKRYELQFPEDNYAEIQAQCLKDLLDFRAEQVYGVEEVKKYTKVSHAV